MLLLLLLQTFSRSCRWQVVLILLGNPSADLPRVRGLVCSSRLGLMLSLYVFPPFDDDGGSTSMTISYMHAGKEDWAVLSGSALPLLIAGVRSSSPPKPHELCVTSGKRVLFRSGLNFDLLNITHPSIQHQIYSCCSHIVHMCWCC